MKITKTEKTEHWQSRQQLESFTAVRDEKS